MDVYLSGSLWGFFPLGSAMKNKRFARVMRDRSGIKYLRSRNGEEQVKRAEKRWEETL